MSEDQDQSHYDVLGVDPNASKDEIREAYRERLGDVQSDVTDAETAKRPEGSRIAAARAEEAKVRAAWQVLSDPVQREKHDTSIGVSRDDPDNTIRDDGGDVDTDEGPVDRTPATRQPRPPRAQAGDRPPGIFSTEHPPTPAAWPKGFQAPPPRARLLALGIDVVVLAIIMIAQQFLGVVAVEQIYPEQTTKLDNISDCLDALNAAKDDAKRGTPKFENLVAKANTECETVNVVTPFAEGSNPTDKQIQNRIDKAEDKQSDVQGEIVPAQFGVLLVAIALALLYLIPSSLRTGRTLGKHLMRIHVVQEDGSKLRFGSAMSRYGTPVLAAFLFASILGPLAFALVLFGVLTWPRNPKYQGLHDRLAHTIVVDG